MKTYEQDLRDEIERTKELIHPKGERHENLGAISYLKQKEAELRGYMRGCEDIRQEYEQRGLFITEGINENAK